MIIIKRIAPEKEITYISNVIDKNIVANKILNDRGLLSENILSQLRNLVEDVAIYINNKDNNLSYDIHYANVDCSMKYVASKQEYRYISKFHDYLQSTASHYTPNEENAESFILYFFRFICMIKETLKNKYDFEILTKLEEFPIYEDTLTKENYDSISLKIEEVELKTNKSLKQGRFYVQKVRPIYSKGKMYYEIILSKATNYINKFEHITMYSKLFIPDNYSVKISYIEKEIEIISVKTKIKIIDNYSISIRPCEIKKMGIIFGLDVKIDDKYVEYTNLMKLMTENDITLLDIINEEDEQFSNIINLIKNNAQNNKLSNLILEMRKFIKKDYKGSNIIRYFACKIDDIVLKDQIQDSANINLSNLHLKNNCIPFDSMPYAMGLYKHKTSWRHLLMSIDMDNREHELLGRDIHFNCEKNNILYTPKEELEKYGNIEQLIDKYNKILETRRIDVSLKNKIVLEHDYLYIDSYEKDSIKIINKLKEYRKESSEYIKILLNDYVDWPFFDITDDKIEIINKFLRNSSICIIHGPAGTGKTKMLEIISEIFKDYSKIFLANTNTAKNNLESRISPIDSENSTFQTVYNYINSNFNNYDILILDECSTVSNNDMCNILSKKYKLVILSGDIYQIESIEYGNWFNLSYNYFKNDFVYDLNKNNRTNEENLIDFWKSVRDNEDDARIKAGNGEFSCEICEKIFEKESEDEIVLCLNYDGLYGINSINKIMQEKNPNEEYNIGVDTFKIGDPIVFNDCPRYKTILNNNMKGIIKNIQIDRDNECNWFEIEVFSSIPLSRCVFSDIQILSHYDQKTLIRFFVRNFKDTNDDENNYEHIIPFNLSYAVSIHKAQGLEYDSVKVVITSSVEDRITKNIFYTAITRAKKHLQIFWSNESQAKIFDNFKKRINSKDISILKGKIQ